MGPEELLGVPLEHLVDVVGELSRNPSILNTRERNEPGFDDQKRRKISQIQVRALGPAASSQQSHLAKLRHKTRCA
jgi:hypothetical protein